jgi:hypothetical protein
MHATQLFAISVSLAHVCLLAGVYLSAGGAQSQMFVSDMLDDQVYFKVLLTLVVVVETITCAAYIYILARPLSFPTASLTVLCLIGSIGGWTSLACTHIGDPIHQAGTIAFLIGTAGNNAVLVSHATRYTWVYILLWIAVLACSVIFLATNYTQQYKTSALTEWISFILQGTSLTIYFFDNPPQQRRETAVVGAEAARPLLLLVNTRQGRQSPSQPARVAGGRRGACLYDDNDEDDDAGQTTSEWNPQW